MSSRPDRVIAEADELNEGSLVIEKVGKYYSLSIEYISTEPGGQDRLIWLGDGETTEELLAVLDQLRSRIDYLSDILKGLQS